MVGLEAQAVGNGDAGGAAPVTLVVQRLQLQRAQALLPQPLLLLPLHPPPQVAAEAAQQHDEPPDEPEAREAGEEGVGALGHHHLGCRPWGEAPASPCPRGGGRDAQGGGRARAGADAVRAAEGISSGCTRRRLLQPVGACRQGSILAMEPGGAGAGGSGLGALGGWWGRGLAGRATGGWGRQGPAAHRWEGALQRDRPERERHGDPAARSHGDSLHMRSGTRSRHGAMSGPTRAPAVAPTVANLHTPPAPCHCAAGYLRVGDRCCGPSASMPSRSRDIHRHLLLSTQCTLSQLQSSGTLAPALPKVGCPRDGCLRHVVLVDARALWLSLALWPPRRVRGWWHPTQQCRRGGGWCQWELSPLPGPCL